MQDITLPRRTLRRGASPIPGPLLVDGAELRRLVDVCFLAHRLGLLDSLVRALEHAVDLFEDEPIRGDEAKAIARAVAAVARIPDWQAVGIVAASGEDGPSRRLVEELDHWEQMLREQAERAAGGGA